MAVGIFLVILKHFIFLAAIGSIVYYHLTQPKIEKSQLPAGLFEKAKYRYKVAPKNSKYALKLGIIFLLIYTILQ